MSHSTPSTTKKHAIFTNEPMGEKGITAVPEVDVANAALLNDEGYVQSGNKSSSTKEQATPTSKNRKGEHGSEDEATSNGEIHQAQNNSESIKESMNTKKIADIPLIGKAYAALLAHNEFSKARQIYGQYLRYDGDKNKFIEWICSLSPERETSKKIPKPAAESVYGEMHKFYCKYNDGYY